MRTRFTKYALLTVLFAAGSSGQVSPTSQVFGLRDATGLTVTNGMKAEAVTYEGRKCVRITKDGLDDQALAFLTGTEFQDGVIEADIAVKPTTPPDVRNPCFIGIAFRAKADGSAYDLLYLRPGNSQAPDQAMRNHAVQYAAEPGFGWYRLRREWPAIYESSADLEPRRWTKVKIEVAGRSAKLYLGGSTKPSLIVDGLKNQELRGAVGLWSFTNEDAYFSNVRITASAAQPIKNGSEAAGTWNVRYSSDVGVVGGSLNLQQEGNTITGTWSGFLGENCPVTGTWHQGYVELAFSGDWPVNAPPGAPGTVRAVLEAWIDGDSGAGRMRVEGHADGRWAATRTRRIQ